MTDTIKEYALAVTIFCIAAGICEIIIPDTNASIGKYVRYVISLCVAAVILIPLGSAFVGRVNDIEKAEIQAVSEYTKEDVADTFIREFRTEVERKAAESAEKNFSLSSGEVKVSVIMNTDDLTNIEIISAYAYLSGEANRCSDSIAEYLSLQLGCPVTVFLG